MITDYASLQAAAAATAQRRDLLPAMPELIQLAEAAILRDLELRDVVAVATGTTSSNMLAIPADLDRIDRISVGVGGRDRTLDYTPMAAHAPASAGSGAPNQFAIENGMIRLLPSPGDGYAFTIFYAPRLVPLGPSNLSNWLLDNAPDVYLHQVCVQIGLRSHDDALIQRHAQFFAAALNGVRSQSERKRLPRAGGLRWRPRSAR